MENKSGNGIFLGVVSVATLVVAIVGATFAYFTSQTASNEGVLDVTSYQFATTVAVEKVAPTDITAGLIPMDGTKVGDAVARKCSADNGYVGCVIYKATLTNASDNPATLSLAVKTNSVDKFQNLMFKEIKSSDNGSTFTDGNVAAISTAAANSYVETNIPAVTVTKGTDVVQYFVVYLNETNADQKDEMAGHFTGQLIYTSTTGAAGQLTATFNA